MIVGRGGERPCDEEKREEEEGRYAEAARKDHVVLLAGRPSRLPP
jgi:hypothetical protein